MNENELYVVKEHKFDNPLFTKIVFLTDNCITDCHSNYFHNFKSKRIFDIIFTNITNNEIINLTISGKSMDLFELNK